MYFSKFIKEFVCFSTFVVALFFLYIFKSLILFEFISGRGVYDIDSTLFSSRWLSFGLFKMCLVKTCLWYDTIYESLKELYPFQILGMPLTERKQKKKFINMSFGLSPNSLILTFSSCSSQRPENLTIDINSFEP